MTLSGLIHLATVRHYSILTGVNTEKKTSQAQRMRLDLGLSAGKAVPMVECFLLKEINVGCFFWAGDVKTFVL